MADQEQTQEQKRQVVHVRVQADAAVVEYMATRIGELLESAGYEVIEQSAAYPSHYAQQGARVFLTVR